MKYLKILMLFVCSLAFVACDNDEPSSESIFDTTTRERSVFEQWLLKHYTVPYNIDFIYRYVDSQTSQAYNVVPPYKDEAQAMAVLIKHIWIESYVEVMDGDSTFIKTYAPRVFQLIGSKQYTGDGSEVLGTAEGGLKITLFGINHINIDSPYMDVESPFHIRNTREYDLNYYIFKTLHHEFCHILNQKENYQEEFQTVSVVVHFRFQRFACGNRGWDITVGPVVFLPKTILDGKPCIVFVDGQLKLGSVLPVNRVCKGL